MRVMRILTRPNVGGPTGQAIALWHAFAAQGVPTLLVTGSVDGSEAMLAPAPHGVPALDFDAALAAGPAASGWVTLPGLARGIAPFADRAAAAALRQLLAAHRPDVVHTHTSKAGWLGRTAAFAAGVPVVAHTFHGHVLQDYFARPLAWLLGRLERRLAARTQLLFAVSPSCADELAAAGVADRDRFVVVPPAVRAPALLSRAAARARLHIPAAERRIVCVGRLVPIKRVDHFVAALAARPELQGDVVGEGPLRERLRQLAAVAAPGRVHFRSARLDIAAELPAYDALVLPSVREGCPLVAIEAFAARVPVVGYDVPGVQDALRHWGNGTLVPVSRGPGGLGDGIAAALVDPVPDNAVAVARCAPAAVADRLLDSYRQALGAGRRYHPRPPD